MADVNPPAPDDFSSHLTCADGVALLRIVGRVDHTSIDRFVTDVRKATEPPASRVVVSLDRATFLSSVAWGTLITGAATMRRRDGVLALCSMRGAIDSSYRLLSLTETLPSYGSEALALQG